jgi:hypothetical protein
VSAGLSPNPSPEVGGALIQKNCVYFVLKYGNNKEGNRKEHVLRSKSRVVYSGFADEKESD